MDAAAKPVSRDSTTVLLAVAAVPAALVAIFAEPGGFSALTVSCALVGLVPWALAAGGIALRPTLFALVAFGAALIIVVVDNNGGGLFPMLLLAIWAPRSVERQRWVEAVIIVGSLAAITALAVRVGSGNGGIAYFSVGVGICWLSGLLLRRQEVLTAQVRAMRDVDLARRASLGFAHLATTRC